jgi:hypothetical protein
VQADSAGHAASYHPAVKEIAALVLLGAAALAQEPLRESSIGEVRGADKKPFAGATVHLLHRAHPSVLDPAYEDHVVATADERGQFKVQLLVGMPYAVWAVGPVVDGTYRCSEVLSDVVPGVPIVLHEAELHYVRRVAIAVDPSWRQPLQFAIGGDVPMRMMQPVQLKDGELSTPQWPGAGCGVSAFEEGVRVYSHSLPLTITGLRDSIRLEADSDVKAPVPDDASLRATLTASLTLSVPRRREYALRFVDAGKDPIAGVEAITTTQWMSEKLGVTGANGLLRVPAADGSEILFSDVVARSAGHAEARVDADMFRKDDDDPKSVPLESGTLVHGRLWLREGHPAGRTVLLLNGSIKIGRNQSYFGVYARESSTEADGSFLVPGRVRGYPFRVTALLTPEQRAALSPDKSAPPLWPSAIVLPEVSAEPKDVGDLRLDRLVPIDVRVFAADHSPPGATKVIAFVVAPQTFDNWPARPECMITDRHGRLRLLAHRDCEIALLVMTQQGSALGFASADHRRLDLNLDPSGVAHLHIVDGENKPLIGNIVDIVGPLGAPSDPEVARVLPQVQQAFSSYSMPWRMGRTDGSGRIDLLMPLPGFDLNLVVYGPDGTTMQKRLPLSPDRGAKPIEVVFTPDKQ